MAYYTIDPDDTDEVGTPQEALAWLLERAAVRPTHTEGVQ